MWNPLAVLALSALPLLLGLRRQPRLTREILGDLRLMRVLHYVALVGLGTALQVRASGGPSLLHMPLLAGVGAYALALLHAAVFAIVSNNVADVDADRISNPTRPLPRGAVPVRPYLGAAMACAAWALVLSALLGPPALLGTAVVTAGYAAYSLPPLRLKRVPLLAKGILGFNSWVMALTGFVMAGGDGGAFPTGWTWCLLVPMSLAANFVDLKDTAGDRATGVVTLPVLLGERAARALISCAVVVTYALGAWLVGIPALVVPVAAMGGLHVFLLYRRPYAEGPVFLTMLTGLVGLDLALLL